MHTNRTCGDRVLLCPACVMSSVTVRTTTHLQSGQQNTFQLQYMQPSFYAILLYKYLAKEHHLLIYTPVFRFSVLWRVAVALG